MNNGADNTENIIVVADKYNFNIIGIDDSIGFNEYSALAHIQCNPYSLFN